MIFGELCVVGLCPEEAIGLRGKSVAVPQLLVKYTLQDAADELTLVIGTICLRI